MLLSLLMGNCKRKNNIIYLYGIYLYIGTLGNKKRANVGGYEKFNKDTSIAALFFLHIYIVMEPKPM